MLADLLMVRGEPHCGLVERPKTCGFARSVGSELEGINPGRRTPLGARPLEAAISGARGYCGPD
jgi:hypothetical protein